MGIKNATWVIEDESIRLPIGKTRPAVAAGRLWLEHSVGNIDYACIVSKSTRRLPRRSHRRHRGLPVPVGVSVRRSTRSQLTRWRKYMQRLSTYGGTLPVSNRRIAVIPRGRHKGHPDGYLHGGWISPWIQHPSYQRQAAIRYGTICMEIMCLTQSSTNGFLRKIGFTILER